MTERRAFLLLLAAGIVFELIAILGLLALGVDGIALSLGALGPLALGSYLSSGIVMHYGASDRQRR